jgi:hypothetical protein
MQARWLALVLVASVAHAEPRLRFGSANPHAAIERASVAIDGGRATITLKLVTQVRDRGEAEVGIDVPAGARVVGLVMHASGLRMVGRRLDVDDAEAKYRAERDRKADPAILDWGGSDGDRDRLRLRVFPIAFYRAATIEIAIELPAIPRLVVDPDGISTTITVGHRTWEDELATHTIAVPPAHAPAADALVDATHALYAEDERPRPGRPPPWPAKPVVASFCGWPTR